MVLTSEERVCASHILIPFKDPKGKIKDKKLLEFAKEVNKGVNEKPELFGAGAYKYSVCPSGQNNAELNLCLNKIYAKNEKEFRSKAEKCVLNYGGNLGCFKKNEVDRTFYNAVKNLKVGKISSEPIKTDFGYHIIKRDVNPEN